MRPTALSLAGVLVGVACCAVTACGGAPNPLGGKGEAGAGSAAGNDSGTVDTPEAGGSMTCAAEVPCGASGMKYEECTEVSASGTCTAIVYAVSDGKSFTCEGCSSCEGTQQALSAYCASGAMPEGGPDDAGVAESGVPDATVEGGADGGHPDGSVHDAGADGGEEGGEDAGVDASLDGAHPDGGPHDASFEGGGDGGGSDAGVDAAVCAPGATRCSGTEVELCGSDGQWGPVESDPIWAVESSAASPDGGLVVMNYDGNNGGPSPTGSGVAPDGRTVTFDVWTAPAMSSVSIMYWLDSDSTNVVAIPLTVSGLTAAGLDRWSGTLPAQLSFTTVTWWAQGTDVCQTAPDYYSNAGNNYSYLTP